jgi:hypothetical protein
MKLRMLNVHSSSIKPSTQIVAISTSFIYSKSFWVSTGDVVTLHQSRVNGFKLLSWSCMTTSELWIMVVLKWEDCKSKVWTSNIVKNKFGIQTNHVGHTEHRI